VFVRDEDRIQSCGVFASRLHAAKELAATQSGVDQDARSASGQDRGVALGA